MWRGSKPAWVAGARGHQVTLFGASEHVGGKARLEAGLPGHGEVEQVYEHQRRMAEVHGVGFRLGASVDTAVVAAESPDVVVLATGAMMREPENVASGQRAYAISA